MKACKSPLADRMLRAGVPVYNHATAGTPIHFEGKTYEAKFMPTRPPRTDDDNLFTDTQFKVIGAIFFTLMGLVTALTFFAK